MLKIGLVANYHFLGGSDPKPIKITSFFNPSLIKMVGSFFYVVCDLFLIPSLIKDPDTLSWWMWYVRLGSKCSLVVRSMYLKIFNLKNLCGKYAFQESSSLMKNETKRLSAKSILAGILKLWSIFEFSEVSYVYGYWHTSKLNSF